jgi:hypothetical protein
MLGSNVHTRLSCFGSRESSDSYVAAISLLGEMLWISDGFDGIASGTPVVSEDGGYIFLTYNSGSGTVGHFAVLNANSDGVEFHSQENSEAPFAPPGIFHAPEEGYYDGGENNRNDIIIWSLSHTTKSDGTVGDGAYYAFQFPIGFTGSADGIAYIQLGQDIRDFQAIAKPVLTNGGRSLYWGGTRSQFFAWAGEAGLDRYRFNRDRTAGAGFSRGDPKSQAVYATPVLSSDPLEPLIFGGSASNEFVRLNHNFTQKLLVNTSSIILAEARLSPDNSFVYYAEFNGRIHQASTEDLMDMWMLDLGLPVEGEFALKADGTALYVADITGFIHTFRLADHPSNAPSFGPTSQPTASRSTGPTTVPSSAPSRTPSSAPTAKQTAQSTPGPTPRPTILVESFVPSPTAKPTPGPTFPSSSPVRSVALALTVSMVAAFAM